MDKHFTVYETKLRLFDRDGYMCVHCGKSIHQFGSPALAHRIKQSEMYLKKYGIDTIYHDLNMASVCSNFCNSRMDLGHKTKLIEDLANKIRKKLEST